jgi:guanylate kinase
LNESSIATTVTTTTATATVANAPSTSVKSAVGSIFVIAAPSGAGKTSLVKALLTEQPLIKVSVSSTTRSVRPGEVDGVDYVFLSEAEFLMRRDAGEFLEWAKVHSNFYGTSKKWIENEIANGIDIILEIDWQGAQQIKRLFPLAVGIFIAPPSMKALKERLDARGQDSDEVIEARLAAAQSEINHASEFEYVIINQDFSDALRDLMQIVAASRLRFKQQAHQFPLLFAGPLPT